MNAELKETRTLVRMLQRMVETYRTTITPGTADEQYATAAAGRAEEALLACLRDAVEELAPRGQVNADRLFEPVPLSFRCEQCGGVPHDLARDLDLLQSKQYRWGQPELHVVLMRAFRYEHRHAKEVVRQLRERDLLADAANESPLLDANARVSAGGAAPLTNRSVKTYA